MAMVCLTSTGKGAPAIASNQYTPLWTYPGRNLGKGGEAIVYVYHVVLNDDDLENIKRWAEARNVTVEEWIQSAVDEQIEAELELERGKEG